MDESDDQRDVELSSLTAIFPEIRRVSEDDPYTITLDVPVNPSKAITVLFPAAADGAPPLDHAPAVNNRTLAGSGAQVNNGNIESHELSHLPPVTLRICLPKNYPLDEPPAVTVTTSPPWLPQDTARKLEADCARLWEELGRDLVVFTFIDHIQQCTDDVFALINDDGVLEIDPQHKIAVLDYDIKAKRAAFENGTFDCGVCLEPKKGKVCHRMMDCGHVFCVQCLQDFYNNAITEGDLASVRCLEPSCAKERGAAQTSTGKKRRKPKTFISPSELLQIPLETDVVKRYVTLKYKTELESDKNTIYCPRTWCQGAARSRKHKKPEGLEFEEGLSDSESEPDDEAEGAGGANGAASSKPPKKYQAKDLLAICEDCGFAFCSRCFQSWHGEFFRCMPRRDKEELSAEEKASLEYVQLHTTPCPTCDCPAQKTHGCNHMICFRCNTHFCYLCSAWLDPGNPYQHFNEMPDGSRTGCYMRLWELEHGDGADVGYGYLGGGGPGQNNNAPAPAAAALEPAQPWHAVPEIEEPDDEEDEEIVGEHDRGEHGRGGNGGQLVPHRRLFPIRQLQAAEIKLATIADDTLSSSNRPTGGAEAEEGADANAGEQGTFV
ncbi:RBR-type E3 ubiquitin transferase [Pleurostoma richardsiae]|uniref:RBR-type E3 ubiquitin transferase n=1 Tax=Pleurostoma richardsiae TaxID=41990 RepID=A0AA38VF65_9PEZI|nr:RBR-type E3 ubiquitin transferase [Pleurostoma richardsiae]